MGKISSLDSDKILLPTTVEPTTITAVREMVGLEIIR